MSADDVPDPEALLDRLIAADAVREADDGELSLSADFDDTLDLYEQSYGDLSGEAFRDAVAEVFGLSETEAARRIDEEGVTVEEFVAYLALQSHFEERADASLPDPVELAVMATIVRQLSPESPVPAAVRDLTDETVEVFLEEHRDAIVTVWTHHCDPCDAMKADLPEILDALPADVPVGGVDGEEAVAFRRRHGVNAAPAMLCFAGGELVEIGEGRLSPAEAAALAERAYCESGSDSCSD